MDGIAQMHLLVSALGKDDEALLLLLLNTRDYAFAGHVGLPKYGAF
jgi:hypothetical protein